MARIRVAMVVAQLWFNPQPGKLHVLCVQTCKRKQQQQQQQQQQTKKTQNTPCYIFFTLKIQDISHPSVYSSIIYNSQDMELTQLPFNR